MKSRSLILTCSIRRLMNPCIWFSDPEITANSRVIIITAGVRQKDGEDRLSLLQRNLDILKTMVPKLVSLSPEAVLIVVSNPGT